MKFKKYISAVIAALLALSVFAGCAKTEEEHSVSNTLYVSPSGSDTEGDGSAEKPFATLGRAKEQVRTLEKSGGDIVVEIADGFYALDRYLPRSRGGAPRYQRRKALRGQLGGRRRGRLAQRRARRL